MYSINLNEISVPLVHKYLLGAVGPRPICFASTMDAGGNPNLAPFSYFNVFSANPPIAIFSPARSGRTGQNKDTLENVLQVPEVVINIVNHALVYQMSLASSPYSKEINEFTKAGLTPVESEKVRPYRVQESPVQMECKVNDVVSLGDKGGAGNLVICEILTMHIDPAILDSDKLIDPTLLDAVARMGGNYYCRAHGDALFEIEKPLTTCGIGVDNLPKHIRLSARLTGNHLGQLANLETLPTQNQIEAVKNKFINVQDIEGAAIALLKKNQTADALALLMSQ